jgi:hypothetical protein
MSAFFDFLSAMQEWALRYALILLLNEGLRSLRYLQITLYIVYHVRFVRKYMELSFKY